MKKNNLKFLEKKLFLALLVLTTATAFSQTITVNPAVSNQTVTFGGDAKLTIGSYANGSTATISQKLFGDMNLKVLRVPIFALQPITDPIYDNVITVINSVKAVNPNVKIFASIANGDGYGTDYHGADKFPASWKGCCSYNVYSLNLTTYAAYLDSFMTRMTNAGITIDYLGPWNEDSADDSDHYKVFSQMTNLGTTKKIGLERWGLLTSISDVNDVEDRTDIIGSHFYDDTTIPEVDWDTKWANLVSESADPVWYTEATRYSTNDNINNLVAGMNNIFPAIRGGSEAVIFYQACNRIVYANGGVPPIKYSGFQNIVNNAAGKVLNSTSTDSTIKVVTFGNNSTLNIHILNTGTTTKTVTLSLSNGYKANGLITRKIWTSTDTGTTNTYTLNGNATWNITVNANSYNHLNIPLNQAVSSKITEGKEILVDDSNETSEIKITPNPSTHGHFKLQLPERTTEDRVVVKMFSLEGKEVFSEVKKYEQNLSIDTKLPSGLYLLSVTTAEKTYHTKVIVK
ncbi:T9SS type A sorting domain-containing protein [Flavobacterium sp. UMI-01]|uniref:T9SS type A sorting domain-containing protein n=1 Tax=Flavobacterium sp. UMI-01 TaxID=1441053 RepID=UPI001C7DCFF5|nr:T9SS type A sorting domain-containing protein [Flavobacterium sp. UMI-01]